ncbi:cation-translocating P-type ATPase [Microcella sp.]|uniref:cation-translocating P-type ATPase n=1 Tax=Microcella sp. TaxID=1913979 RepID=UPI002563DFFE|nr:HAD-IC family P-type ATPase [Microcella sp.]MBX9470631.1 HAD-IC family P-type ATPase [Microcella sp.]
MSADADIAWHEESIDEVLEALDTSTFGLSETEVLARRAEVGVNELVSAPATPWWRTLLRQFWSPLIAILLGAAIITALLQKWVDATAIMVVLVLNASIGFWQERRAASEVRALARLSSPHCRVVRDGREVELDARDVVPGDIVLLSSGERVAADLRLLDAITLQIDESMLTGEVMPASKEIAPVARSSGVGDRSCMAYSGTFVVSGRGAGVAVATGAHTEIGLINELVQRASPLTPLQRLTRQLERRIGVLIGAVCAVVFIAGAVSGGDLAEVFLSAVALAVASIPEALPIVLTIAMSIGVARMAKRRAVLRTLPAVETLGSTTIIGSDKTGTLTQNVLTVEEVWTPDGRTVLASPSTGARPDPLLPETLRAGALTNEARASAESRTGFVGDAVDVAMAIVAIKSGALALEDLEAPALLHVPYEPELGYCQTVRQLPDGRRMLYVKGSPDKLLNMATTMRTVVADEPIDVEEVSDANHEMASRGLRVIATAERVLDDDEGHDGFLAIPARLTLLGLEGMTDPPRPGVAAAIAACQDAGIAVKMITGDHPSTAEAIADRLGIPRRGPAITGDEMSRLDDDLLVARLRETSVAARVSPQDKLRIVTVLQAAGEVVAVTGDGVNDAPALKAASIGVAMGESGTEVAREAADLVLADDNFATIVGAVHQGRVTFAAIRKATFFLLSTALGIIIAVLINVFSDQPLLFLPVQILWINLVTNGLQDVALAFEPAEGGELSRPPRSRNEGLLSRVLWIRLIVTGAWIGMVILVTFSWATAAGYDDDHARTLALTMLVCMNFFHAGSSRAEHRSLFALSPVSNPFLLITAAGSLLLQAGAMSWAPSAAVLGLSPLSLSEWVVCFAVGSTVLVIVEIEKLVRQGVETRSRKNTPGGI